MHAPAAPKQATVAVDGLPIWGEVDPGSSIHPWGTSASRATVGERSIIPPLEPLYPPPWISPFQPISEKALDLNRWPIQKQPPRQRSEFHRPFTLRACPIRKTITCCPEAHQRSVSDPNNHAQFSAVHELSRCRYARKPWLDGLPFLRRPLSLLSGCLSAPYYWLPSSGLFSD